MKQKAINDIENIYNLALKNDQFNIALKAKELILKLNENKEQDKDFSTKIQISNEEIEKLIKSISDELSNTN